MADNRSGAIGPSSVNEHSCNAMAQPAHAEPGAVASHQDW